MEDLVYDVNAKRNLLNINKSNRQTINKLHKNQYSYIWRVSATEIDNHDDTHFFGANFRPISFTLDECTVSSFLPEYTEQVDTPICNAVNVLTIDSG